MTSLSKPQAEHPEPGSAEMTNLKTEANLKSVAELEAGGMEHNDAVWFIESHNMVVHVFHNSPKAAFQDSAPGVLERYMMLEAQAAAIYGGEAVPTVLAFHVPGESLQQIIAVVNDAVRKIKISLEHYGEGDALDSALAAEGGRIDAAFRTDVPTESPVIDRINQMVVLGADDRVLVERALALHESRPESTRVAANRIAAEVRELRPTG